MRNNIVSLGADELKYEIREIVAVAKEFRKLGVEIMWENIGDPVQKGEKIPTGSRTSSSSAIARGRDLRLFAHQGP